METCIAILRGINVSGVRKLPMADLRALFGTLKCTNVRTYIQSGNVIFEVAKLDPRFAATVEGKINKQFGFDVPVLVRTLKEMKQVVVANPFLKQKGIDLEKLHVTFLADTPKDASPAKGANGPDSFTLIGREVYVHCPEGYGNTKLNNTFFEKQFKVSATTRNWRTVNELVRIGEAG